MDNKDPETGAFPEFPSIETGGSKLILEPPVLQDTPDDNKKVAKTGNKAAPKLVAAAGKGAAPTTKGGTTACVSDVVIMQRLQSLYMS